MKISIPQNIYSAIIAMQLPNKLKNNIEIVASSLITQNIKNDTADIGLIPIMDLLKNHDFYVSKKTAISFDGELSNSYIYYGEELENKTDVYLRGDVSSNEIIISKMLFSELYSTEINLILDASEILAENKNYIVVGNDNFFNLDIAKGVSFADQVTELVNFPYVNYVWVSKDKNMLVDFNEIFESIDEKIEDSIDKILNSMKLRNDLKDFIKINLNSVYFEMTENEVHGLNELLRLPYYHGIAEEIVELKFV